MKKLLIIALILATSILFGREKIYDKNGKHIGYVEGSSSNPVFYDQFGNKVTGSSSAQEQYFNQLLQDRDLQKLHDDLENIKKKRENSSENFDETMEFIFGKRNPSSYQPTYRYTPPVIPKCGCCQTILESTNKTNFCQPYCECKVDREKSANRLALGFLGVGLVCVLLVIL